MPPAPIVSGAFMKPEKPIASVSVPPVLTTIGVAIAAGVERFSVALAPTLIAPVLFRLPVTVSVCAVVPRSVIVPVPVTVLPLNECDPSPLIVRLFAPRARLAELLRKRCPGVATVHVAMRSERTG